MLRQALRKALHGFADCSLLFLSLLQHAQAMPGDWATYVVSTYIDSNVQIMIWSCAHRPWDSMARGKCCKCKALKAQASFSLAKFPFVCVPAEARDTAGISTARHSMCLDELLRALST